MSGRGAGLLAALLASLLAAPGAPGADEVGDLNDKARAALDRDRPQEAITLLEKARLLEPDEPVLSRNLAYAYFKRGQQMLAARRLASAVADYGRAIELDPDEIGFALHLGQLHLRSYHLTSASRVLRAAVDRFGDGAAEAWLMLGDVLNLDDDLAGAQQAYERAVELAPSAAGGPERGRQVLEQARTAAARNARQHAVEKDYVTDTTPSFVLRYPAHTGGPSYGVRLVNVLERARAEVCQALGVSPPRQRITVVLYPPDEFKAATGTHEWVAGLFDRKIRLPIADVVADADKIEAAFRHEFTHLVVSEIAPSCPSVINEGLAQVLEVGRGHGLPRLVDWLDARGSRDAAPRIADLPERFMDLGHVDEVRRAYLLSYAFVDHVVAHHGMRAATGWIKESTARPLSEAYRAAVGRSLPDEEALFRDLLRRAP